MSETTDTARLLAEGVSIELAGGAAVAIVIDAGTMARLEDRYESLDGFREALDKGMSGKFIHHLAFVFYALGLAESEEEALGLIDTRRLIEYLDALDVAFSQAMPPQPEGAEKNGRAARRAAARSRGVATSGPPSRSGTSRRPSSGG